jgi:Uma2 family endonuclease
MLSHSESYGLGVRPFSQVTPHNRGMATRTLLSLGEFERLPDDGLKHELDEGELITMPPPSLDYGDLQSQIAMFLRQFAQQHKLGAVRTESGFVLEQDPATVRGPDVSFVRASREKAEGSWGHGAPDLAVEIVSPSDSAGEIERKVRQYLAAGGRMVWVVYPRSRSVHVFEPGGVARIVEADQHIEAPELLPGFSVAVKEFFES